MTRKFRSLRHGPTDAERFLWRSLRERQGRCSRFKRRSTVRAQVVDCLCEDARLAVEHDGSHRCQELQSNSETCRDRYLVGLGIAVGRFTDQELRTNLPRLLAQTFATRKGRPKPLPLLHPGEDRSDGREKRKDQAIMPDNPTALFSKRIVANKRTFYMDIRETRDRTPYLVISARQRNEAGEPDNVRIFIFPDQLHAFHAGFEEAVTAMIARLPPQK